MSTWGSYSYAFGPLMGLIGIGILVLLLRWAFSRGHSVVARTPRAGTADDYGVLIPVSSPATYIDGEIQRRTLEAAGIRATLANTLDGPRLLVFPEDKDRAGTVLRSR